MSKICKKISYFIFIIVILLVTSSFMNKTLKDEKPTIVTTTTMITDMVNIIVGDKFEVIGLMGVGVDPHLYKATAGDVTKIENADVIIYNGLHLEGKVTDIFSNITNKEVISLEDAYEDYELIESDGELDPHIWYDVSLWSKAVSFVTEKIVKIDQENQEYYVENAKLYLNELEELDEYIKNRINELENGSKALITAHDAFGYFGRAYGVEVLAIQGISTSSEATTNDINDLANYIFDKKVKAIFMESSVSTKSINSLIEAVKSKGFETTLGGELYSDSLGDEKSNTESYVKTMIYNVDTIVDALK